MIFFLILLFIQPSQNSVLQCLRNCTISSKNHNIYQNCNDLNSISINDFDKYECNIELKRNCYIYSISKCDINWSNDEIRNKCEIKFKENFDKNILNQIPVYSFTKNFTYKNIFCATCNYETIENLKMYTLEAEAYFGNPETCFLDDLNNCKFSFLPPVSNIVKNECIKSTYYYDNPSKMAADKCHNQKGYRYTTIDNNKLCAICDGKPETYLECEILELHDFQISKNNLQVFINLSDTTRQIITEFTKNITNRQQNKSTVISGKCKNVESSFDILLCNNDLSILKTKKKDDTMINYLTLSVNIISIISLFLLLIIFSFVKKLRHLDVKILMSLCVSLLFAQAFFLISVYIPKKELDNLKVCYLFGILRHYFYLTYFAWLNIMSYDLFRVLNIFSRVINESNKLFIKYSLYAWLSPAIIIVILLLTQIPRNDYELYERIFCFISHKIDLLIFFIIPISFILMSKLIFLIISSIYIRIIDKTSNLCLRNEVVTGSTSQNILIENLTEPAGNELVQILKHKIDIHKKAKQNEFHKQRLVLFIKLFVLISINWMASILATFYKESFIWFIHLTINSVQGFLVFCLILFSRQTLDEIKRKHIFNSDSLSHAFNIK
jgi:hypothetical protein